MLTRRRKGGGGRRGKSRQRKCKKSLWGGTGSSSERRGSLKGQVLCVRKSDGQKQGEGARDKVGATHRSGSPSWEKPHPNYYEILSSILMMKRIREKPSKKSKVTDSQAWSSETTTVTFALCVLPKCPDAF